MQFVMVAAGSNDASDGQAEIILAFLKKTCAKTS